MSTTTNISNALFNDSAKETHWIENVTNAGSVAKVGGAFSHLWKVISGEFAEQDKTINALVKASEKVVDALAARDLTPDEAANRRVTAPVYGKSHSDATNKLAIAEEKLQGFYDLFKQRIKQLGQDVNNPDFGNYINAARQKLIDVATAKSPKIKHDKIMQDKLKTAGNRFNEIALDDVINEYVQDKKGSKNGLVEIAKNFNDEVDGIIAASKGLKRADVERKLRNKIDDEFADILANDKKYTALVNKYADLSVDAKTVKVAEKTIKKDLVAEQKKLEKKRVTLCGKDGFNGKIHKAFEKAKKARENMVKLSGDYTLARNAFAGGKGKVRAVDQNATLEEQEKQTVARAKALAGLSIKGNKKLGGLKKKLVAATKDYVAKRKVYTDLDKQLAKIAVWDKQTGAMKPESRLKKIEANLAPNALALSARAETNKVVKFLAEIKKPVTEKNQNIRSKALNAIFHPQAVNA